MRLIAKTLILVGALSLPVVATEGAEGSAPAAKPTEAVVTKEANATAKTDTKAMKKKTSKHTAKAGAKKNEDEAKPTN